MPPQIRDMTADDYDQVRALWQATEHMGIGDSDTRERTAAFLNRNAGLSLVAEEAGVVVAAVLCGTDGRWGHLYHLAVAKSHRKRGLGKQLVETCLDRLREQGIRACGIFVYTANTDGIAFWKRLGWRQWEEVDVTAMYTKTARE